MNISKQFRLTGSLLVALFAALASAALSPAHARRGDVGLLEAFRLYTPAQLSSTFDGCRKLFPAGKPIELSSVPQRLQPRGLCSNNFAVLHSGASKTPLVVVERLNRQTVEDAKGERRTNEFYADPRLPRRERAELDDYRGSGYDRGHLSPAANQPDPTAMAQSFALSNVIPQDPTNNQKIWAKLESDTRKFAKRAKGDVYVFSGPLFAKGYRAIGDVWVPTHLFKLVYDEAGGRAWAHVLPNTADAIIHRPMSYTEFVEATGWKLLQHVQLRDTGQ